MVITQTPVRISFFGGGTDYPAWSRQHGGAVLATTIDKYIYISCRRLPPFHEHKHRIIYSKIESVRTIDEIVHPAVREVFRFMQVENGLEMHHDSDLPARAGMGSSSGFTVGLLHALHALRGEMVDKARLAEESIRVEREMIGENVGSQDQVMAATGGFNLVQFHPNETVSVQTVVLPQARLQELESHLMLFYTGQQRVASQIAATQIQNIPNRQQELKSMLQLVAQGTEILQSSTDISAFGELLHTSWELKKQLSGKITNPQIDLIYENARAAGAIGGKLLGAGGGGFVLLFAKPAQQAAIRQRLHGLLHVPFKFESGGSRVIFYRQTP